MNRQALVRYISLALIGLLFIGQYSGSIRMLDRFLYLPVWAWCFLLLWVSAALQQRRIDKRAILIGFLVACIGAVLALLVIFGLGLLVDSRDPVIIKS